MSIPGIAQSVLAFGGIVLAAISLSVSWWTVRFSYPTSGGTESGTIHFVPGASAQAVINGVSISLPYAAIEESVASLYGTVQLALIIIAIAAGVTAVLAGVACVSVKSRPWASLVGTGFNVVAVVGAGLLVGLFPFAEPQSLPNGADTVYGGCLNLSSPCGSFYGSFTGYGGPSSWGPEVGWYLAIAAMALLGIAVSLSFASMRSASAAETVNLAS